MIFIKWLWWCFLLWFTVGAKWIYFDIEMDAFLNKTWTEVEMESRTKQF